MTRAAWLTLLFCAAASAAPPLPLHFHDDASESATAIYHLACLGEQIHCSKKNFETFWHKQLAWTKEDQTELDAWNNILRKVGDAALPPEPAPYLGNSVGLMPMVDAQHRVIRAALESRSLPDFQGRTWQWIKNDEAARLYRAIEHFRVRLHPSWQSAGHKEVKDILPQVEKSLRQYGTLDLAAQMAVFLESKLHTQDVYFHAVPGPVFESDAASATVISNHVFLEVTSQAKPVAAASILTHELTHYFYDNAPASKQVALREEFARSGVADASSLYAFLSEAIAVAVQALIAEHSKSTEDEYRDAFIPRLGRSTTPLLKDALAKGTTLFQPGFVEAYIREGNRELGTDVTNPKFVLTSAAFLPTEKGAAGYELFLQEFGPMSFIKSDQWSQFPNENLVFLTSYEEWGSLPKNFPELTTYAKKRAFAYMATSNDRKAICVIAGADSAAIVEAVKALAKVKSLPASGLVVSIE